MRKAHLYLASLAIALNMSPAFGQRLIQYQLASPANCYGRVPDHPTIVIPHDPLYWTGRCVNGWMEGVGEVQRYRNGALMEREITQMHLGIRSGSDVSYVTDRNSRYYGMQTYSRWQNGFPYGEMTAAASDGTVLNTWEADGQGGMRQTMNPLNPLMREFGRAAAREYPGLGLFIYMFSPPGARPSASNVTTCQSMMRAQGFTRDVYGFWCTGLPVH